MNPMMQMMSMMGAGSMMGGGMMGDAELLGTAVGEVRYDIPLCAQVAIQNLNGSFLDGAQISVWADPVSQDGSKLIIQGLSPTTQWQELKDHFATCGQVAFANVKGGVGKGKGKGMSMNPMMAKMNMM